MTATEFKILLVIINFALIFLWIVIAISFFIKGERMKRTEFFIITVYPNRIDHPIETIVSRNNYYDFDKQSGIIRIYGERIAHTFNANEVYKITIEPFTTQSRKEIKK